MQQRASIISDPSRLQRSNGLDGLDEYNIRFCESIGSIRTRDATKASNEWGRGRTATASAEQNVVERVPYEKPPFTLGDIKKAIPPHCFKRSVIHSFYYVVDDLIIAYYFYYLATTYIPQLSHPLSNLAWPVYWFCQGSILTGLWVIGHECGHHAFSDYQWLDDTVGFILHYALLTPYFSWKYSHRNHHANTNSLENDEVYIPKRRDNVQFYYKIFNHPPGRLFLLLFILTIRFPLYLLCNVSWKQYDFWASHFHPQSPIYTNRECAQVLLSDVVMIEVIYALYHLVAAKGAAWVFNVYGAPVMVVNGFFIIITYLHHTHLSLPHYDSTEWEWPRGALSTVDRDFGFLNRVLHDVTHTHVLHLLISYIPHYHAKEARDAINPILGKYYMIDRTPIIKAMWREAKECIYVEPDEDDKNGGVFWYHNKM